MATAVQIQALIVDELSEREMGLMRLTVAIRRSISQVKQPKGDLSAIVKTGLKALIASKTVVDADGMYSLRRP